MKARAVAWRYFAGTFGDVQWNRESRSPPLIDELCVPLGHLAVHLEDRGDVLDGTLVDVKTFVVEHAAVVGDTEKMLHAAIHQM